MSKRLAALAAVVLLGGCGGSMPTISADSSEHFQDGGVIFGSGHRTGSDSTATNPENESATTQEQGGGVIFGSGH